MRKTVTIASGTSLSGALNLGPMVTGIVAIEMPAAWTAANLTFQVSTDGTTYVNLYNDGGTEATITAAASQTLSMRQDMTAILSKFRWLKIRSGTSGTPVNQGADRSLAVYAR